MFLRILPVATSAYPHFMPGLLTASWQFCTISGRHAGGAWGFRTILARPPGGRLATWYILNTRVTQWMLEHLFSRPLVPWNIRSRTVHYLELLFLGPFVSWNFRSWEWINPKTFPSANHSFPGPFVPWNFCSSYPGCFLPRIIRSFVSRVHLLVHLQRRTGTA